jgi:hypothetical protein
LYVGKARKRGEEKNERNLILLKMRGNKEGKICRFIVKNIYIYLVEEELVIERREEMMMLVKMGK